MFIPTPRLLGLTIIGIIPIAISESTALSIYIALVWAAVVAGVGVVDGLMTPNPSDLAWRRDHDSKLYLGAWNTIKLSLVNRSVRPARFRVRDATPALFRTEGNVVRGVCKPRDRDVVEYRVMPIHRGDYRFGPLTARLLGPLGLVWRQRAWPLAGDVKVYPNLLAIRSYESLARRGQLQEMGLRTVRRFGGGTEFDQLRDYTRDDEYRRINWKATARAGHLVSADFRTERAQNVFLVLDAGRLMTAPVPIDSTAPGNSAEPHGRAEALHYRPGVAHGAVNPPALTRFDHAVNAAVLLAFVAQQTGDRIGLVCFGEQIIRYLAPRPGRRSFLTVTHAIHDVQPEPVEPDYGFALRYLAARQRQRSLVVLFTDVTEAEAALTLIHPVHYLARRHLCLVVTLRDPELERMYNLIPTESKSLYERAVAGTVLEERSRILQLLRQRGVLTLDVVADKLSAGVLNRYLEIKGRSLL